MMDAEPRWPLFSYRFSLLVGRPSFVPAGRCEVHCAVEYTFLLSSTSCLFTTDYSLGFPFTLFFLMGLIPDHHFFKKHLVNIGTGSFRILEGKRPCRLA
jgi:hypothetical protein